MSEMTRPDMTVDALVAHMRAVAPHPPADVRQENDRAVRTARITTLLDSAARRARVASSFPPLAPFQGLLRYPARWAAQLVLFLSSFITDAQEQFNLTLLQALRDLNETVRRLPPAPPPVLDAQAAERRAADAMYAALSDHFRGPPEMIRERLRVYLPLLRDARGAIPSLPLLDLGCGRGEWLDLARAENWAARGVDSSAAAVEQCRQRGLDVVEMDALAYLRLQADHSAAAVTAFHVIEHLPFHELVQLFDETVRVLHPGGVAIFETPNPENVQVGSCKFYLDPTHQRPLPSAVVKFVAEARGLCQVEVRYLHPSLEALPADGSPLMERFNGLLYGPQDYAVVARRP